ncbi:gastric inhibitory polypeptide-like [Haemorhous mexicanus]|uniref:gastric inhibitory polypeptide-like n=1 Tax=Haemorhous mexicanus TaxID=30427 RepID=UPI0028BD7232|nr:gastric inhibitory polypeptide-like [Haemorhous mexicanus]
MTALRAAAAAAAGRLGVLGAEESAGASPAVPAVRLSRRYSEATLASDYSRTMDHVLRKNFVEWLLARRERNSPAAGTPRGENRDLGASPGRPRENREKPSFPALEGSEGLREFWEQEFLRWLSSGQLCGATAT